MPDEPVANRPDGSDPVPAAESTGDQATADGGPGDRRDDHQEQGHPAGRRRSGTKETGAGGADRPPVTPSAKSVRGRLVKALVRPGRGQIIVAVLLLLFGLAFVTQVRTISQGSAYTDARRDDLIQILDGLTAENRRLESEESDLEKTRSDLQSGADAQAVAREQAESRIEMLSILAGTVPAQGPGITMVITDPQQKVTSDLLLEAVEEMRDAGAEVIEVDDSIRLVASSWFGTDASGDLVIDGKPVHRPIKIDVIGDPHALSEGANFRGGIVSEITSAKVGGQVTITPHDNVQITALHSQKDNEYAQPAPPRPTR